MKKQWKKKRSKQSGINKCIFTRLDALKILQNQMANENMDVDQEEKEQDVLVCKCQTVYDEDGPMMKCDECGVFFHIECVELDEELYDYYLDNDVMWFCDECD